jgi:signal transduction histidine kinase
MVFNSICVLSYSQISDSISLTNEYQRSKILIKENQVDSAIILMNEISASSLKNEYWDLFTDSKIELARIHGLNEDLNKSLTNYVELIRALTRIERNDLLAKTYYSLGEDYARFELYNKAIRYFSNANEYYEKSGDLDKIVESLILLSELYFEIENYELSDSTLKEAIVLIERNELDQDLIPLFKNQIIIYENLNRPASMLEVNLKLFEEYKRQNNAKLMIEIHNNLGYNYAAIGNYEMALDEFINSYQTSVIANDPDSIKMDILTNIGIVYSHLNMNSIAIDTFSIVEDYYQKVKNYDKLALAQDMIAEVYLKEDDLSNALSYSKKSVENAETSENIEILRDCYRTYSEIFQESDDFKNGLKYYRIYVMLDDSISKLNIKRTLELGLREEDIHYSERRALLMVLDEEIEELSFKNLQIEAEKKQKETDLLKAEKNLAKQSFRRKLFIVILSFVTVSLILILIGFFTKRKDNRLLIQQKESILNINRKLESKNEALAEAMKQIKMAQGKLVESEKMASLGQLTAGIAHEINNPVNFISSNVVPLKLNIKEILEILNAYRESSNHTAAKKDLSNAKLLEEKYDLNYMIKEIDALINGISEGATRSKEIIEGLRNFSRMDKHALKEADLHEIIDSTLLLLRNKYKEHIEIVKDYNINIQLIQCYPVQLSQVFMNVLNNAIQAIDKKGLISIKTDLSDNSVIIMISDNGKGIEKDNLDNIFDPFFTTKEIGEGTGLGLSITYGIIQEHGGDIQVESEVGVGTTIKITLPLEQPE